MKPWQLNRKIKGLSNRIYDSIETETRIDVSSFSEPERKLLDKVQEIVDKYAPAKRHRKELGFMAQRLRNLC